MRRYEQITVKAKDIKGRSFVMTPEPGTLLARAIQHELDHLNGVLFVDHVLNRDEADTLLKENNLPLTETARMAHEPDLEAALANLGKHNKIPLRG